MQCPAMWSYVMAAARGDPRRRPGSVFTVQSANCGPGPCRDGLNCSRYPLNSGYKSATFQKDGISRGFSRDELDTTLSRDGSRDVLAEVRVHTPYSERCHSPSDTPFTQPLQVFTFFVWGNFHGKYLPIMARLNPAFKRGIWKVAHKSWDKHFQNYLCPKY